MGENTIFVKLYEADNEALAVNDKEIWRYSGCLGLEKGVDSELAKVLAEVKKELQDAFAYKVCYRRMDVEWENGMPLLPFETPSKDLAFCLKGSSEVILFAATVGLEIDRRIAKYKRFSPTKALLMQAYGAERVETLCNAFCREMEKVFAEEGLSCTARFSPGYGDLPLKEQKKVFELLDCNRKIGISLNESMLMTPSKSVTALFGIGKCTRTKQGHECENCNKSDCEYRK